MPGLDEYPNVKRSHIVPGMYLRAWADGQTIAMHRLGDGKVELRNIKSVGIQKRYYRRTRPTGEKIDDVEWSLGQGEDAAAPLLRELEQRWPLELSAKAALAQFFGIQHVRGPAFRTWHENWIRSKAKELDASASPVAGLPAGAKRDAEVRDWESEKTGDTERNVRMLSIGRLVATLIGSMHWTLVTIDKPWFATSDQPVIVWPLERGTARPSANDLDAGLEDMLEVFVPVSPDRLLVMTWIDEVDSSQVQRGSGRHAGTANAFVMRNAHAEWFHHPQAKVPVARGPRRPLSYDLGLTNSPAVLAASKRRQEALRIAQPIIGAPLSNDDIPIVTVNER
jgi:hypothetical protein